jgi:hypothetical protein
LRYPGRRIACSSVLRASFSSASTSLVVVDTEKVQPQLCTHRSSARVSPRLRHAPHFHAAPACPPVRPLRAGGRVVLRAFGPHEAWTSGRRDHQWGLVPGQG